MSVNKYDCCMPTCAFVSQTDFTGATMEHVGFKCDRITPRAAKGLRKRFRAIEHASHLPHTADIPLGYVDVELCCAIEHVLHVRHLADIPLGYVAVKMCRAMEHLFHVRHTADIPLADVVIECIGLRENTAHV